MSLQETQQQALKGVLTKRTGRLTKEEIWYIRSSPLPMRMLARDLHISLTMVKWIKDRKRYAYVPEED